jgi:iron complex outermembrane receptor protein
VDVPAITVLGVGEQSNPLDSVPTVTELSGSRLEKKKQSTVGETLAHEPGMASSQFGPNASRPVIRGQDGDRVRILQNGTGVLDASAASQDHAVALDPLVVDRIEVVRGPAALLYGPQAVGGAVDMITSRIPEKQADKAHGKAELRYSTNDQGRAGGASVDAPIGARVTAHVDANARANDDYHIPGFARTASVRQSDPLPSGEDESQGRVYNSYNRTQSGALGASYIGDHEFIGTSFSDYNSRYGTVADRFVNIHLTQQRWDVTGEKRDLGFIQSARVHNSFSHYKHDEIDQGGEIGTTFKNDGDEARIDLKHKTWQDFNGVFGAQANLFTFSAKGDEAFLPTTDNADAALFVFEEKQTGKFRPSFGARVDASSVRSKDDAAFGPGVSRSFNGGSASLGLLYQLTSVQALVLNTSYTQRAPNYEELFARGPHDATGLYERGDHDLKKEESRSAELSWRAKSPIVQASVTAFVQDFHHYISLTPTGETPIDSLPVYQYDSVDARFFGGELDLRHKILQPVWGGQFEVEVKADVLRGINRDTGENLPRITPVRESVALNYKADRWQGDFEVQRAERQTLTAPNETQTPDYTLVNLGAETPFEWGGTEYSFFARLNNIFNVDARNHVSVLKDVAPLPGRNLMAGIQATF